MTSCRSKFPVLLPLQPSDVNDGGVVIGIISFPVGLPIIQSFVWHRGSYTVIKESSSDVTLLGSITNSGRIFGNWGSFNVQHAGTSSAIATTVATKGS